MAGRRDHLLRTPAAYERFAVEYDRGKEDRSWLAPLIARLGELLPRESLLLDLGCGPGRETAELQAAGWGVVGLDIADAFLRIARTRFPSFGFVRGDMVHLPFGAASFDGVWAAASLLHLAAGEVGSALAEVTRVLRPGGILYCSMQIGSVAGMVPPTEHETVQAERYYTFYEPGDWRGRLEDAGFETLSFDAIEFPPHIAATSCNRGARGWINALARSRDPGARPGT
jgi:ubiquinone/menaquinone biosynthesis C-methylase UbiE